MIAELVASDRSHTIKLGEIGALYAALRVHDGFRKAPDRLRHIARFNQQFGEPRLELAYDDRSAGRLKPADVFDGPSDSAVTISALRLQESQDDPLHLLPEPKPLFYRDLNCTVDNRPELPPFACENEKVRRYAQAMNQRRRMLHILGHGMGPR